MAMVPGRNNDAVLARLMRAAVEDPAQALDKVGIATCSTVVRAAAAALPVGGGGGRRVSWLRVPLLVACFFGGVCAMWASVWVRADASQRRATGQVLLAVAVVNLLVAIALCDFDPQIALNIFDAML